MKKAICILLAASLLLALSACAAGSAKEGTGGDTSIGDLFWDILQGKRGDTQEPQALTLRIINQTGGGLKNIGISRSQNGIHCGSTGMEHADNSLIPQGDVCSFAFLPEDFPSKDLTNLRFDVFAGVAAGEDNFYCGGISLDNPALGDTYTFELRFEDGTYSLWQVLENGVYAEMPKTVKQEAPAEPEPPEKTESEPITFDPADLTGPWHVDADRNDLQALYAQFEGFGEFGAVMELRSNGQMSWHIGAEGGSGSYTVEGTALTATVTRTIDNTPMTTVFDVLRDGDELYLGMQTENGSVYWSWGEDDSANLSGEETASYPGEDVVELVNLRGDETTVYKLADGRYMDRTTTFFTFDGIDTWTDESGTEWNEKAQ